LPRFESLQAALECGANLALISAIPSDRAQLTVKAMQQGMDVMSDKPGCTTLAQLEQIKACVAQTGRIWSVNFSERFETPASTLASQLVAEGAIGQVVQTVGLGPHRLNRATRPDWFFRKACFGGILTDIASHQIDQFLHYTGSDKAEVTHAFTANYANPGDSEVQDFGEINLRSDRGTGYIRVDWFTLVNGDRCEKIDASAAGLPYFARLAYDIENRSETAMRQAHCFTVMELALRAQQMADEL